MATRIDYNTLIRFIMYKETGDTKKVRILPDRIVIEMPGTSIETRYSIIEVKVSDSGEPMVFLRDPKRYTTVRITGSMITIENAVAKHETVIMKPPKLFRHSAVTTIENMLALQRI